MRVGSLFFYEELKIWIDKRYPEHHVEDFCSMENYYASWSYTYGIKKNSSVYRIRYSGSDVYYDTNIFIFLLNTSRILSVNFQYIAKIIL